MTDNHSPNSAGTSQNREQQGERYPESRPYRERLGGQSVVHLRRIGNGFGLALTALVIWFAGGFVLLPAHSTDASSGSPADDPFAGQWIIEPARDPALLHLTFNYPSSRPGRGNSISSSPVRRDQVRGLTETQVSAGGTVQFQIVRDAGTFNCEGWFKNGKGSGHFTFAANPAFAGELTRRGFAAPSQEQLFSLAIDDVGMAFVDELAAQGYERPTLDQLVRMGDHGVRLDYIRDLRADGYTVRSADLLVRMVDHGVSSDLIKELSSLGYGHPPVEMLIRTVDHGVTPNYIRELSALGHKELQLDQLIHLVDHGVTVRFISEIDSAGYGHPSLDQLVRMRDHGVDARFIQKTKERGFENLTIDELIRMADRGFKD